MLAETCQRQDAADPENRGVWFGNILGWISIAIELLIAANVIHA